MDAYTRCPHQRPTPPRRPSMLARTGRAVAEPVADVVNAAAGLRHGTVRKPKRRPSSATREKQALAFREAIVSLVILILAVISGVWTFEGAYLQNQRVGGDSFNVFCYAALLAIGVTAAQVTAWWVLIRIIPGLNRGRTLVLGVALTAALQAWTFSVSSLNNAVALTGGPAIVRELEEQSAAYARAVETATANALAVKPFVSLIVGEATARCNLARAEREDGAVTGASGPGAVSATLSLLCDQSRANARRIQEVVETTERRAREIQATLSKMDGVIYDASLSVFERETKFIDLAGKVEAWLRQTRSDDLTEALRTSHAAMASSISNLPAKDGALGQRQAAIIVGLKESVAETGQLYSEVADTLANRPDAATPPPARRVSIVNAVRESAPHHLPSAAAAIGIDSFQLFIVLAFILARAATRKRAAPAAARHPPNPRPKETSQKQEKAQ